MRSRSCAPTSSPGTGSCPRSRSARRAERAMGEPLVCPGCGETHASSERFCRVCGMPLVRAGALGSELAVSEAHERARKIKPQYAEGDLVRVAGGRNQAEA